MAMSGFTGISYPFRVDSQGNTVLSSTSKFDPTHIEESIIQSLGIHAMECPMEFDVYTDLDTSLYEPNDDSLQAILKNQIVETLGRLDERIEVNESDIDFRTENIDGSEILYVDVTYLVLQYDTYYTISINLGEVL